MADRATAGARDGIRRTRRHRRARARVPRPHAFGAPSGTFLFVLSDFLEPPPVAAWLEAGARRWDVVPVVIQDPLWEQSFPDVGSVVVPIADPPGAAPRLVRLTRARRAPAATSTKNAARSSSRSSSRSASLPSSSAATGRTRSTRHSCGGPTRARPPGGVDDRRGGLLRQSSPLRPRRPVDVVAPPATPNFADRVTATRRSSSTAERSIPVAPRRRGVRAARGARRPRRPAPRRRGGQDGGRLPLDRRVPGRGLRSGDAPRTIALPPLRLSGTREDGSQARWSSAGRRSRSPDASRGRAGKATPPFRRETGLPQASYRVSPEQLGDVLDILAVVLVGAAVVIGARALLRTGAVASTSGSLA